MILNKKKGIKLLAAATGILLLIIWGIRVIQFNKSCIAADEVPVENYSIGEYASFDNNYSYGSYADGYSIRVDDYHIMNTADYLAQYGKAPEDFWSSHERVCLVDITVRYDETSLECENNGLCLQDIYLCGLDYYEGQNSEFFDLENPDLEGSRGIVLTDGQEYTVTLVFNLIERYYTAYNWKNMDKLPMMLYLTAYPVQKNIVLQNPLT